FSEIPLPTRTEHNKSDCTTWRIRSANRIFPGPQPRNIFGSNFRRDEIRKEGLIFGSQILYKAQTQSVVNRCRQKSNDNPSVVLAFQLNSQVLINEKNSKKK